MREACEEVGLTDFESKPLGSYIFESDRERELVNAYMTITDCELKPSDELDGGRFWSEEEIAANLNTDTFTPNFAQEYIRLSLRSNTTFFQK